VIHKVYEPYIRALLGTAAHFCEVVANPAIVTRVAVWPRLEASEHYSMADIPPLPESFRLPKENATGGGAAAGGGGAAEDGDEWGEQPQEKKVSNFRPPPSPLHPSLNPWALTTNPRARSLHLSRLSLVRTLPAPA